MKETKGCLWLAVLVAVLWFNSSSFGLETLRLGTMAATNPYYSLTLYAAEEKGFFKENGLQVNWTPFRASAPMYQGLIAGSLDMGMSTIFSAIPAIARGAPIIIVADVQNKQDFFVWVRADSPIKRPDDLKGKKIGVTRLGGAVDGYARMLTKALGIEKEVKLVAAGGIPQAVAALKAGVVDAIIYPLNTVIKLKVAGEARELLAIEDYLPKDRIDIVMYTRKDFAQDKPLLVTAGIKAVLAGINFALANRAWSLAKLTSAVGFTTQEATILLEDMKAGKDGKISRQGVVNVLNFLIEYGIVKKEAAPSLDSLYTARFVGER